MRLHLTNILWKVLKIIQSYNTYGSPRNPVQGQYLYGNTRPILGVKHKLRRLWLNIAQSTTSSLIGT